MVDRERGHRSKKLLRKQKNQLLQKTGKPALCCGGTVRVKKDVFIIDRVVDEDFQHLQTNSR